jgi:glycosyltransferase involved in cell wall biosynthesis
MAVLEAMTVGVPVLAADRGALPEVTGGAARLFEPDDDVGLTGMLEALLDSADTRTAMREAGWRRAQDFDWKASARTLREAWAEAVLSRRSRRA